MSPRDSLTPSALASAIVAGAVTAAATTWLLSPARPGPPTPAPPATSGDASWPEVLAGIDALRREQQELRERLATLESRPPTIVRTPAEALTPAAEREARSEMRSPQAPRSVALPPRQELQQQIAEALTSIRKAEAIEKVQRATEQRAGRLEQRLSTLTERLGLDAYQVNEMRTILATRDERDQNLIRMWEAGVDREVLGQTKRSYADEFQTAVSGVLTPVQLETWQRDRDGGDK